MRSEDLTLDHLKRLNVRELELVDLGPDWLERNANEYLSSEFKKAVLDKDGEVAFVFGGKIIDGDGWVWILSSDLIYKNPIASLETILRLHKEGCDLFPQVKRCFTINDPAFPDAIRFLERIGYIQSGTCTGTDGKERILLIKEIR